MGRFTHLPLLAAIALFPGTASAIPYFYAVAPSNGSTSLIEIDPTNASIVSTVNLAASGISTYSLAFSPTNTLYGWDTTSGQLYTINSTSATTAGITRIGAANGEKVTGLAFDQSGALFGLRQYGSGLTDFDFVSINTTTSAVTKIGNLGITIQSNGLAVDFATGDIYGVSGNGYDEVFKIDKMTGLATIIGSLGTTTAGVGTEFLPGSLDLYSVRNYDYLWKYNVTTGQSAYVGDLGGTAVKYNVVSLAAKWPGRTPTAIPEPATLLLLGGGLAGLAGMRRARRG